MRAEKLAKVEAVRDLDWTERGLRDAAGEIAKIADFVFGEEAPC